MTFRERMYLEMIDYKTIRGLISADNSNLAFGSKGEITDSSADFKPFSQDTVDTVNSILTEDYKNTLALRGDVETVRDVEKRTREKMQKSAVSLVSGKGAVETFDSIFNERWNVSNSLDAQTAIGITPQLYISPYECNSLYTHGLFNIITSKKSKSVLINGFNISNEYFSDDDMKRIEYNCYDKNLSFNLSDIVTNSLVYGGGVIFPMFKKDTPLTTAMSLGELIKNGILKKNSIDYILKLDRWQTMIVPPCNPTQKHFEFPDNYIIPYLGSSVNADRVSRIVPNRLVGFWGTIANQGWGISDFQFYLESEFAYEMIQRELPVMVSQMSLLYRKINVDGVLASEGANALDSLVSEGTIKMRDASPENPINLDILGDIGVINRDFDGVPGLCKLLIKKLCAEAKIYEPTVFTQDKGNFASGDDTQGILMKQYENNMYIYKELEPQLRKLAKILVIDALGTDDHILRKLKYTKFEFNSPIAVNALDKAKIGESFSKIVLNLVGARIPIDTAVDIADEYVDNKDKTINNSIREKLIETQKMFEEIDRQNMIETKGNSINAENRTSKSEKIESRREQKASPNTQRFQKLN